MHIIARQDRIAIRNNRLFMAYYVIIYIDTELFVVTRHQLVSSR